MRIWLLALVLLTACLLATSVRADDVGAIDGARQLANHNVEPAYFHHVRLNVTDLASSLRFYSKLLGAVQLEYCRKTPALFTERSFLLLNKVNHPPDHLPHSAISHIGWASVNGQADFEWLTSQGVEFETPITQLGNDHGMYFFGPDKELIELWTGGRNHRFDHDRPPNSVPPYERESGVKGSVFCWSEAVGRTEKEHRAANGAGVW